MLDGIRVVDLTRALMRSGLGVSTRGEGRGTRSGCRARFKMNLGPGGGLHPWLPSAQGGNRCAVLLGSETTGRRGSVWTVKPEDHRRRASGQCPEVASWVAPGESGIMVLKQQSRPQNKEHPIAGLRNRNHPARVEIAFDKARPGGQMQSEAAGLPV